MVSKTKLFAEDTLYYTVNTLVINYFHIRMHLRYLTVI